MQRDTTLYKIPVINAEGNAISVETTQGSDTNQTHIVFCGGFNSSMRGLKAEFLYQICLQQGWTYTRFDYRGHGESDAEAEHCSAHDWLRDTLAVIDQLDKNVVLVGSSMGAWLAIHAQLKRPEKIKALLTIAAAPDFPQLLLWPALSGEQQKALLQGECITRATPYDDAHWRIRKALIDSGKELALLDNDDTLPVNIPIRMLHGTNDQDVPWEFSQRLLEKFTHSPSATLTLIQGADHRLSTPADLQLLEEQLHQLLALT